MTAVPVGVLCALAVWLLWPKGAERLREFAPAGRAPSIGRRNGRRKLRRRGAGRGGAEPVTVADLMDELASMLRAGATNGEVFRQLELLHVGDEQAEFTRDVAGQVALGEPVSAAIRSAVGALPSGDRSAAAGLAAGWQVAAECGVPLAGCITRYAASVRSEADARRAREAAMAGPRATVTVLTWLPAGGLGLAMVLGARPLAVFTGSTAGWVCLLAGVGLLVVGRRWMAFLLARAGRRRP